MDAKANYLRFDTEIKNAVVKLINTRRVLNTEWVGTFSVFANKKSFQKGESLFSFSHLVVTQDENPEEIFFTSLEDSGVLSKVKINK